MARLWYGHYRNRRINQVSTVYQPYIYRVCTVISRGRTEEIYNLQIYDVRFILGLGKMYDFWKTGGDIALLRNNLPCIM